MNLTWISHLNEAQQAVAGVVLALYTLASALSALFGFVGAFYAPAKVWAQHCSDVGLRLHKVGEKIGTLVKSAGPPPPPAALLALALMGTTLSGCAMTSAISAWFRKETPIIVHDLEVDSADVPCLIEHAPYPVTVAGVLAALHACGVDSQLQQLVTDLYKGKAVPLKGGGSMQLAALPSRRRDGGL